MVKRVVCMVLDHNWSRQRYPACKATISPRDLPQVRPLRKGRRRARPARRPDGHGVLKIRVLATAPKAASVCAVWFDALPSPLSQLIPDRDCCGWHVGTSGSSTGGQRHVVDRQMT